MAYLAPTIIHRQTTPQEDAVAIAVFAPSMLTPLHTCMLMSPCLSQLIGCVLDVEYRPRCFCAHTVVLEHPSMFHQPCHGTGLILSVPGVFSHVLALNTQGGMGRLRIEHKVVVTVRAILVAACPSAYNPQPKCFSTIPVLKLAGILAEALLALLTCEGHLEALEQRVVRGLLVAFRAVEPFAACGCYCLARGYM